MSVNYTQEEAERLANVTTTQVLDWQRVMARTKLLAMLQDNQLATEDLDACIRYDLLDDMGADLDTLRSDLEAYAARVRYAQHVLEAPGERLAGVDQASMTGGGRHGGR